MVTTTTTKAAETPTSKAWGHLLLRTARQAKAPLPPEALVERSLASRGLLADRRARELATRSLEYTVQVGKLCRSLGPDGGALVSLPLPAADPAAAAVVTEAKRQAVERPCLPGRVHHLLLEQAFEGRAWGACIHGCGTVRVYRSDHTELLRPNSWTDEARQGQREAASDDYLIRRYYAELRGTEA